MYDQASIRDIRIYENIRECIVSIKATMLCSIRKSHIEETLSARIRYALCARAVYCVQIKRL